MINALLKILFSLDLLKEEDKAGQQSFLKFLRMFVFAQIF
jgi:hypothetical protein